MKDPPCAVSLEGATDGGKERERSHTDRGVDVAFPVVTSAKEVL